MYVTEFQYAFTKLENSMSDSSCWSMLQSCFANDKAT